MKTIKRIIYILILIIGIDLLIAAFHSNDLLTLIGGIVITIGGTYINHDFIEKIVKWDF